MREVLIDAGKRGLDGMYIPHNFMETNARGQIIPSILSVKLLGCLNERTLQACVFQ